jgi:hypothetical protein
MHSDTSTDRRKKLRYLAYIEVAVGLLVGFLINFLLWQQSNHAAHLWRNLFVTGLAAISAGVLIGVVGRIALRAPLLDPGESVEHAFQVDKLVDICRKEGWLDIADGLLDYSRRRDATEITISMLPADIRKAFTTRGFAAEVIQRRLAELNADS